jgi:hypothetical protein
MPDHIKTIHIHNREALEWYNKQENKFQYIIDLILKDKREREKYMSREDVSEIVSNTIMSILGNCKIEGDKIIIKKPLEEINKDDLQNLITKRLKHGGTYIGDWDNEDSEFKSKKNKKGVIDQ